MNPTIPILEKLIALLTQLRDILNARKTSVPVVMTPFQNFCAFIKNKENANPANNNPFDDRFYFGGYLPKYGIVQAASPCLRRFR